MEKVKEKLKVMYIVGVVLFCAYAVIYVLSIAVWADVPKDTDRWEEVTINGIYARLPEKKPAVVSFWENVHDDMSIDYARELNNLRIYDTQTEPMYMVRVAGYQVNNTEFAHPDREPKYNVQYNCFWLLICKQRFGLTTGNFPDAYYDEVSGYYYYSWEHDGVLGSGSTLFGMMTGTNADYYYFNGAVNNGPFLDSKDISSAFVRDFVGYEAVDNVHYFNLKNYVIDDGGIPEKRSEKVYDLPVPQNMRVAHTGSMGRFEFNLIWDIADEMYEDDKLYMLDKAEVEVMSSCKLNYYPQPWSKGTLISIPKHNINHGLDTASMASLSESSDYLKSRTFKYDISKDGDVIDAIAQKRGISYDITAASSFIDRDGKDMIKKESYPTFWVRVKYKNPLYDVNGIGDGKTHYSNWIKLEDVGKCTGYIVNEISGLRKDDDDADETPEEIDNSSGAYDGGTDVLVDDDNQLPYVTNDDYYVPNNSAWGLIQRILADVKQFPQFFATFFSFLPVAFGDMLAVLIIVIIGIGVFRKLFVGS